MYENGSIVPEKIEMGLLCSIYLFCRYEILTPNAIPKGFMDGKQACVLMVRTENHEQLLRLWLQSSVLSCSCLHHVRSKPWNWTKTCTALAKVRSSSELESWLTWRRSET